MGGAFADSELAASAPPASLAWASWHEPAAAEALRCSRAIVGRDDLIRRLNTERSILVVEHDFQMSLPSRTRVGDAPGKPSRNRPLLSPDISPYSVHRGGESVKIIVLQ